MNKRFLKTLAGTFALTTTLLLTSCYSVFSGGTGGIIVDAESTSTPKAGIPFVDVYAYTDSGTRDSAYNSWREGTVFSPSIFLIRFSARSITAVRDSLCRVSPFFR